MNNAYYTIFGNSWVNPCDSCGRSSGKKSILSPTFQEQRENSGIA